MNKIIIGATIILGVGLSSCSTNHNSISNSKKLNKMEVSNKEKVVSLLKAIETGATEPISYINPNKYIQHNLGVADGLAGFGALLKHCHQIQQK